MTCHNPATFAQETYPTRPEAFESPTPNPRRIVKRTPAFTSNPLERLAQLMNANERLMDELATSRSRIADARSYLDRTGSNLRFGEALLDRCRAKHSQILAQLRANRIESLQLLEEGGSGV